MEKLVSVILPTYNGANHLNKAINSILNQAYKNWELLVIDDGSTDNTREVVENFSKNDLRIKYIKNEANFGIQKTLNRGLKEAQGEYIARIDDDDMWADAHKLSKQVEFLENNLEYVLIGTGVIVVDENDKELFRYLLPTEDKSIKSKILSKNCFAHSSVLFRKIFAIKFGGYSESSEVKHIEDYDLWLKLGISGKLANLPIYGVKFRLRDESISSKNKVEQFRKIIKLIKNYKKKYPNYLSALLRSFIRLIVYGFIIKSPIKFSLNRITKLYKERY